MDAATFARKWIASQRTERAASQEHFLDLCALVDEATPNEADPTGDVYAFEKGAERTSAGDGFADVWLKDKFGWEYKGKRRDLRAAYKQLLDYHEALGQPPLLVVCDLERFEVHTKWTGFESWTYEFNLTHLTSDEPVRVLTSRGDPAAGADSLTALQVLKALWAEPERLKPVRTTEEITAEAAKLFGEVVELLREWARARGEEPDDAGIARFVSRAVFCMFATDIGLLPRGAFSDLLGAQAANPGQFREALAELFRKMEGGGLYGSHTIPWINGDLFTDYDVPDDLTTQEILKLQELDALNWADVEPTIFGTLFERVLDPDVRAALGAHYTSRADIETLVEPVLMAPLRREWQSVREAAEEAREQARLHGATGETEQERIREHVGPFLDRLTGVTVLDPACGSGNFLYVSLALLKGLEKEAIAWAGLQGVRFEPRVHPSQLRGIEINPYAHELASIVVWIGYLQWKLRNAIPLDNEEPILQKLDQITLMDAILSPDGSHEPEWPAADVIVGNPPFLGGKRLRTELGDEYVDAMFDVWEGQVQRTADLCCYWHEKARRMVHAGRVKRAGLLATQAIRGGSSRETLARVKESGDIFFAESNRKWILDGASVRIAMVGFDDGTETDYLLDGKSVEGINVNLTSGLPLAEAEVLGENAGISFMGTTKVGPFEIETAMAQRMLGQPNPDGRDNADVVRPWVNADDVAGRLRDMWIVDFPPGTTLEEAQLYEAPFQYVAEHVESARARSRRKAYRERWWIHGEARPGMRKGLAPLRRFLVTPRVAKHRLFRWVEHPTLPDVRLFAFARDDDYFFGVLHSLAHELWSLGTSSWHGVGNDPTYNNTTCFQTFPLPWPPGDEPADSPLVEAIAGAARRLNELREGWLNPEGPLVGEEELKRRTLTNLYNERPAWLDTAHRNLDEAVFNAYGWPPNLTDDEVLARLLALNQERAAAQA